jgi:AcrR family transcriptional regulator
MGARAQAMEETRRSILVAGLERARETMSVDVPLADIAGRAGVSVQTVLRHFGSKEGLYSELETFASSQVMAERSAAAGDVVAVVHALIGHYESTGDWALVMLAAERRDDRARQVTDRGRDLHRDWVRSAFAPQLSERLPRNRGQLTDLLVVATDVYAWKLLRRDRGLRPSAVERRICLMVQALLNSEELR